MPSDGEFDVTSLMGVIYWFLCQTCSQIWLPHFYLTHSKYACIVTAPADLNCIRAAARFALFEVPPFWEAQVTKHHERMQCGSSLATSDVPCASRLSRGLECECGRPWSF